MEIEGLSQRELMLTVYWLDLKYLPLRFESNLTPNS